MPRGTKVVSAETCGISAWTKTAKVSVILPDGHPKRYFLKVSLDAFRRSTPLNEELVPNSVRQGRVLDPWPRANFTLHQQSMLRSQDLCPKKLDGANIRVMDRKCPSF